MPEAPTVNVAVSPLLAIWSAGCEVIVGAMAPPPAAVTLSLAPPLVMLPAELLTTTVKIAPSSAVVSAAVV